MHKDINSNIFSQSAHYFKILGNETRLCILCNLCKNKQLRVSDLVSCAYKTQSYVSQELAKLKNWKIVDFNQIGLEKYYYLIDDKICKLLNESKKIF